MTQILFTSEKCLKCLSCEFACAVEHSETKDRLRAHTESVKPLPRRNVEPFESASVTVTCRHCEEPLCVESCIAGAMTKNADGSVVCNTERCTACWMCVLSCPFGAIKVKRAFAVKCDLCPDRDGFACIEACPTHALTEAGGVRAARPPEKARPKRPPKKRLAVARRKAPRPGSKRPKSGRKR